MPSAYESKGMGESASDSPDPILERLLLHLVSEWGERQVGVALRHVTTERIESGHGKASGHPKRASRKLSPHELAERVRVSKRKKSLMLELADRFDTKRFLPTISDIRTFLEIRGIEASGLKQRSSSFRKILSALTKMSAEEMEEIVELEAYSGPSRLGPLSAAIESAGIAMRSAQRAGRQTANVREERTGYQLDFSAPAPESDAVTEDARLPSRRRLRGHNT